MQIGSTGGADSENRSSDSEGEGCDTSKRIQNVAEFKLSSGILSFSIVNASMRRVKNSIESYYPIEEPDDFDDDSNSTSALVLHMFVVQAKSLQECQIIYQPCVAEKTERSSLNSKRSQTPEDNLLIKEEPESPNSGTVGAVQLDALFAKSAKRASTGSSSAMVAVAAAAAAAPSAILQDATKEAAKSESPQLSSAYTQQVNLMTPDAFSASGTAAAAAVFVSTSTTTSIGTDSSTTTSGQDRSIDSAVLQTIRMLATVTSKTSENPNAEVLLNLMNNTLIEDREQQKLKEKLDARKKFIAIDRNPERNVAENLASGSSSPSREVQEIMATQDDADAYEAELENLDDDDDDEEEELANSSPLPEAVDGTWPIVKLSSHSAELQNAAQIMSQAVQNTNNGNVPPTLGGGHNNNTSVGSNSNNNTATTLSTSNTSSSNNAGGTCVDSSGTGELNAKMELLIGKWLWSSIRNFKYFILKEAWWRNVLQILTISHKLFADLVKAQSKQINKLENEVNKLQKQQEAAAALHSKQDTSLEPKNLSQLAYKIEMQLSKLMEQYLKRYENEHKKKLTEFLAAR